MKLKKLNNRTAQGPEFTVSVPSRHEISYEESGKTLSVWIEGGWNEKGEHDWLVYARDLKGWLPPHDLDPFPPEEKSRILDNITHSLALLDMKYQLL